MSYRPLRMEGDPLALHATYHFKLPGWACKLPPLFKRIFLISTENRRIFRHEPLLNRSLMCKTKLNMAPCHLYEIHFDDLGIEKEIKMMIYFKELILEHVQQA